MGNAFSRVCLFAVDNQNGSSYFDQTWW